MISLLSFDSVMPAPAAIEKIENAIHLIRGQKVMLDSDLAAFYGVTTKRLLEQLKRNLKRFPTDFAFRLDAEEFERLRSHFATSKPGRGGRRYLPWAFTEHGAVMLASVLNSKIAVEASVRIVRVFLRLRDLLLANKDLALKFHELEGRMDKQDTNISRLFDAIRQFLQPSLAADREMGFHVREDEPAYGKNRKSR